MNAALILHAFSIQIAAVGFPVGDGVPGKWEELQSVFTLPDTSIYTLGAHLIVGGVLAMYLRFLYRWASPHTSADSIARVFPLLTMVTIAVIAIVKSSLALSLGLVGALSIVRFRAAIKDPEELVYLFLCIGVGLALGAEQLWIGLALVVVASLFALIFDRLRPGGRSSDAYLTIIGDAAQYFSDEQTSALEAVRQLCPRLTVQRCEVDGGEGQLRVRLHRLPRGAESRLVADLRQRLPECQIAYVNTESML